MALGSLFIEPPLGIRSSLANNFLKLSLRKGNTVVAARLLKVHLRPAGHEGRRLRLHRGRLRQGVMGEPVLFVGLLGVGLKGHTVEVSGGDNGFLTARGGWQWAQSQQLSKHSSRPN